MTVWMDQLGERVPPPEPVFEFVEGHVHHHNGSFNVTFREAHSGDLVPVALSRADLEAEANEYGVRSLALVRADEQWAKREANQ